MRRLELVAENAYKDKLIRGFCHLYIGQEAVASGLEASMTPEDLVITAYRDHAHMLTCGSDDVAILGELFGREVGCSRGKGGSMHMFTERFFGGNGIVGAQVPLGAGIALALKTKAANAGVDTPIVQVLYGDGAANQGQVFEAFNMAKLWSLPAIFICESNGVAMGTTVDRHAANTDFYTRGDTIPGLWVDGMDVLAVRDAGVWAKKMAQTEGPVLLETATYRYRGHSMSDPGTSYRSREDVKKVMTEQDAIELVRSRLIDSGVADAKELKAMEKEIRKSVEANRDEALKSPELPADELITDVYSVPPKGMFVRGVELNQSWRY